MNQTAKGSLSPCLVKIENSTFNALDLVPRRTTVEKIIELSLAGIPAGPPASTELLQELLTSIDGQSVADLRVLVFGGGTGLATIIGGDSSHHDWPSSPFQGLKEVFPKCRAVVCVTDDGGSTGELLKDLPLIGLGDLRHVLLAALRRDNLQKIYSLSSAACLKLVERLHGLFNLRFTKCPDKIEDLLALPELNFGLLPRFLAHELKGLIKLLFTNPTLHKALKRPQCLGNLLLAAAIVQDDLCLSGVTNEAVKDGINFVAQLIGVDQDHVLPCTVTPCQLKILYNNGVLITGEHKSATARRGSPVDHAFVEFAGQPQVLPEVLSEISQADIIIFAPGSLYSSIVPVLQAPGVSDAIRCNTQAVKILVANIWAQAGETDIALDAPDRRYYVSDLIKAYQRNIPQGINGLFHVVVTLGMRDIPGSIIQSYAVEGKTPIFLDRDNILAMGLVPVEANIFSKQALQARTLKHDHRAFAKTVKAIWWGRASFDAPQSSEKLPQNVAHEKYFIKEDGLACQRFGRICSLLKQRSFAEYDMVSEILWRHKDIPVAHLEFVDGLKLVDVDMWSRSQKWDNVFSFYDPDDRFIKIRKNVVSEPEKFEVAFLVALGQSLLGNYWRKKKIKSLTQEGDNLGRIYQIWLQDIEKYRCYFNRQDLEEYLILARMNRSQVNGALFWRMLNGGEGFTPPGMLFGLIYAWYLDNQLASHVEYKMSISKMPVSDLVPEQVKTLIRRNAMIKFFREKVFRQNIFI